MTLSTIQIMALEALADGQHRTRYEIRRQCSNRVPHRQTLRKLERSGLITEHDRLDGPETYTITPEGLSALEAHNTTKGRKP